MSNIFEMYISFSRLLAFGSAVLGMIGLYVFLTRTYVGTAIRAIAQDREIMVLMGVDAKKSLPHYPILRLIHASHYDWGDCIAGFFPCRIINDSLNTSTASRT